MTHILNKELIFQKLLKNGLKDKIKIDEPLKKHTSYRIGGPVDFYCIPENLEELKKIFSIVISEKIPYKLIGNGTNLLVRDKGCSGIIIQLGKGFKTVTLSDKILKAGAGIGLPVISQFAFRKNLSGLEFAVNIPGTLGGAIVNNASFKNNSIGDVVDSITILTKDNKLKSIPRSRLDFQYRSCKIKEKFAVIVQVDLLLKNNQMENIRSEIAKNINLRAKKQPMNGFNAGSIFKNPEGYSAGALIEKVGGKELSKGNAEVSKIHANFIINKGNASAEDVLYLISEIEKRIDSKYGIQLEREIEIIGNE